MFNRGASGLALVFVLHAIGSALSGCSSDEAGLSAVPIQPAEPDILQAEVTDPLAELKMIAERGREKAATNDKIILEDVSVDVEESSSLVNPYIGRIASTWIHVGERNGVDRVAVYYKYVDGKWKPIWANRASSRSKFTEPLTEAEASRTPPNQTYPWPSGTGSQFTVWVP